MVRIGMSLLVGFVLLSGCVKREQPASTEISSELIGADIETVEAPEDVLASLEVEAADDLAEMVQPSVPLIDSEIPRDATNLNWYGRTSGLYRTSYGEMNAVLGGTPFRYGSWNHYYPLMINAATGRMCRSWGWSGGGDVEWVDIRSGSVTFACFHGVVRWVPAYVFASVGINIDGRTFGVDHPLFTASGAARMARNLDGRAYGGILQEYGGGNAVISLVYSGFNRGANVEWGRTYGLAVPNPRDYYRYLHLEHLAGHLCRAVHRAVFGKVTESNGATGAITLQCGT